MAKRLNWKLYEAELELLSDDLVARREPYSAIEERLESIFGPAGEIRGVDLRLLAFLEYLFTRSQGPYAPGFLKYSHIINVIIRRSWTLRNMLNKSGAHAIGNMVLNGRGKLNFKISDYNELSYILDFWQGCGLWTQTPRTVFDAILSKRIVQNRIVSRDADLLIRLSNIFPMFESEIIPSDLDLSPIREGSQNPFPKYFESITQDYLSQGKTISEIIEIENLRAGKTLSRRNQYLSYLVKKRCNFQCQICVAGDPAKYPSFIQVHHITPLSENGDDHSSNMIVVCNHHHQEIHRGQIQIKKGEVLSIEGNGKKFTTNPN